MKDLQPTAETSDENNPEFPLAIEHDLLVEQFCVGILYISQLQK